MIISSFAILIYDMDVLDRFVLDRFRGCLFGVAVGDALGMPLEGYTSAEICCQFGLVRDMMPAAKGHFHEGLVAGQFTDDTEETLMLAESLIKASGFSGADFAKKLMAWGELWEKDERLCRGVGLATRSAVQNMISGVSWCESGVSIPTCGSAIRASPIGLLFNGDLGLVSKYAQLQSIPTHCGGASQAGAVAVATGVALCLKCFDREMVLKTAASQAARLDGDLAKQLLFVLSLKNIESEVALSQIKSSPLAHDTVPAAFYYFLKFEPEEALIQAVNAGGDTDSIASITGSLFGAALGPSWIPDRWMSLLEQKERIEETARGLADLYYSFDR